MSAEARAFVREFVGRESSPEDPWTGKPFVAQEAEKRSNDADKEEVKSAVEQLVDEDELLYWHGLIARPTPEILHAIIERERDAETTRKLLIGEVNRFLGSGSP